MRPRALAFTLVAFLLGGMRLSAYPTSVDIIPTAYVMDIDTANLQLESDGWRTPFSHDREVSLYTEIGITKYFEAGLDLPNCTDESRWLLNAKWQFLPESKQRPAMAVGVLDPTRGGIFSEWYAVASKDVGALHLHAGYLDLGDGLHRSMVGAEYDVVKVGTITADWITGSGAYHTLGLYRDITNNLGVLVYYGRANQRGAGDFVGLNVCWSLPLKKPVGGDAE